MTRLRRSLARPLALRFGTVLLASFAAGSVFSPSVAQAVSETEVRAHLVALRKPIIAAEISGRILVVHALPGQSFERNTPLVGFECAPHQARESRAQAMRDRAARQVASLQQLDRSGATSRLEVGLAAADLAGAEADLRLAQFIVQRCDIRAPFDGAVVEQRVQAGEYVAEGQPVLEIIDHAQLELEAIVPSQLLSWLREGTTFEVEFDDLPGTLPARVSRIVPLIDPVSQTVKIYALVRPGAARLLAGMSGRARFQPSSGMR